MALTAIGAIRSMGSKLVPHLRTASAANNFSPCVAKMQPFQSLLLPITVQDVTGHQIVTPGAAAISDETKISEELETPTTLQCVSTRRELRQWRNRRKRDGGKDRRFRLKYG
eukprot:TRINITY_DN11366_c0_g1_i1.p2 TRINITY_DN11366_c0_g1~~TRINITY_DN11366_c0_g1_i1.p2  ORF type:complete len:112 (-),score=16.70 TRINITY_DN11366_c0_g1_i1:363-698(-)